MEGLPVDGRSDLYSLGLVGYEMLTGRRPWEGATLYATIYNHKNEAIPPLEERRRGLYSLGLVGYEMLTGRRPWEGATLYATIYNHKNEAIPPLEELRPGVPPRLAGALEGARRQDRPA